MTTSPTIDPIGPADRVAAPPGPVRKSPLVRAQTPPAKSAAKPAAAKPPQAKPAPRRRFMALAGAVCGVGLVALAGAGAYVALRGGEAPPTKPKVATARFGPVADLPDLRDGVPALMQRSPGAAPSTVPPRAEAPPAAEDDLRKAMASTVASAGSTLALQAAALREPAASPAAAPTPASQPIADAARPARPVRPIPMEPPTETASLGEPQSVRTVPAPSSPPPAAATPPAVTAPPAAAAPALPDLRAGDAAPARAEVPPSSAPAATAAAPSQASLPSHAPLPPQRPAFASTDAAERAPVASRPPTSVAPARPRPAPQPAPQARPMQPERSAAAERSAPARTASQEERSLLGIPVPGFVPTGRDIRDAASSIADAVTSIPDNF